MNKLIEKIKFRAEDELTRTDHCDVNVPRLGSKCSLKEFYAFELRIGKHLPSLLKQIYVLVGNGGFGPGYGFMMLENNINSSEDTVLDIYQSFCTEDPEDELWDWPRELIPIIDWGCAIRSCIDCDNDAIYIFVPNIEVDDMDDYFIPQSDSFESFLLKWRDGVNLWEEVYGE